MEIKTKKIINETGLCINNCNNDITYNYEYNSKCYDNCPKGYYIDNNNIKKCKCELDKCHSCSNVALAKNLCTECNTDYYLKENDPLNIGESINCYKNPKGYYLDKKDYLYKKCYYKCQTCEINGNDMNHNCLECNLEYNVKINKNGYTNCEYCIFFYYIDEKNEFHCTINESCPIEYPILIKDRFECIQPSFNTTEINYNITETQKPIKKDEIQNLALIFLNNKTEEENKKYDKIIESVESIFTNNYDTTNLDSGKDDEIVTEKMNITLTTTNNQKDNINNNKTIIDLGQCETLLRNYYNISNDSLLYIKKIDILQEGMKIPKIEYDIYSKLNGSYLTKLDINSCKNNKINILIPVANVDNIDKLNSSSGYYNDFCYTATSDNGTDLILKDRKNEFINKNKTICQEDCAFSNYNYTSQKANCSCDIKESPSLFEDMGINKTKLYENLKDITNIINLKILKCYKKLFNDKNSIIKNIGFYITIFIILFHIVSFFIFFIQQIKEIKRIINKIISALKNLKKDVNKESKENNKLKMKKSDKKNKKKKNSFNKINHGNNPPIKKRNTMQNLNKKRINIDIDDIIDNKRDKNKNKIHLGKNRKNRKTTTTGEFENKTNSLMINENKNNQGMIEKYKKIAELSNEEKNKLTYKEALKLDQRTFCEYYISLLLTKHILLFPFYKDYNSQIIKIDLFFLSFIIYYTVNALFFNDNTMHKIYENEGSFNLEYQLPQIIYSSLISGFLNSFLKLLALSSDDIIQLKRSKNNIKNIEGKKGELYNKLRIKFFLFSIVGFIFLVFFWFDLSMFGAIYPNTQYHLIKDTLISFGLSLIYPLGIYLL